jgi:hypothetical protein
MFFGNWHSLPFLSGVQFAHDMGLLQVAWTCRHTQTHTHTYISIYIHIYIYRHTDINTYILLCPVQNVHVYTYIHIINIIFAYFCMNANPKYFEAAASGTFFASEVAGINSCRLAVLSVIS